MRKFLKKIAATMFTVVNSKRWDGDLHHLHVKLPWSRGFSGRVFSVLLGLESAEKFKGRLEWAKKDGRPLPKRGFQFQLHLGNGPGYIRGWGLWVGRYLKGVSGVEMYQINPSLQCGKGRGMTPGWY